jgi:outer membrane scaffolding protein for murein synthesis (MipA/OmpV family)
MRVRFVILLVALLTSTGLAAQEAPRNSMWSVMIGGGAMVLPDYPGSDEHRVFPFPMTQVSYRNRVFLGPSTTGTGVGLGAYAIRTPRVGLVAEVGFLDSRPASRADALAGTDDRDVVATTSMSLSYALSAFEAVLSVTQGINDNAGLLAGARVSFTQPIGGRIIATASRACSNARQMRWTLRPALKEPSPGSSRREMIGSLPMKGAPTSRTAD